MLCVKIGPLLPRRAPHRCSCRRLSERVRMVFSLRTPPPHQRPKNALHQKWMDPTPGRSPVRWIWTMLSAPVIASTTKIPAAHARAGLGAVMEAARWATPLPPPRETLEVLLTGYSRRRAVRGPPGQPPPPTRWGGQRSGRPERPRRSLQFVFILILYNRF